MSLQDPKPTEIHQDNCPRCNRIRAFVLLRTPDTNEPVAKKQLFTQKLWFPKPPYLYLYECAFCGKRMWRNP